MCTAIQTRHAIIWSMRYDYRITNKWSIWKLNQGENRHCCKLANFNRSFVYVVCVYDIQTATSSYSNSFVMRFAIVLCTFIMISAQLPFDINRTLEFEEFPPRIYTYPNQTESPIRNWILLNRNRILLCSTFSHAYCCQHMRVTNIRYK